MHIICSLLFKQTYRQRKWINAREPEHLHGDISGSDFVYYDDKQIRQQPWSLLLEFEFSKISTSSVSY